MTYTIITKDRVVKIKANSYGDIIKFESHNDFIKFYTLFDDGVHKRLQQREIARIRKDDILLMTDDSYCDVADRKNGEADESTTDN